MGLFINTNQSALNGQRQLSKSTSALATSFERLSSGLRINSAKDDAAGLSISTRLTAQTKGLNQAVRNCSDGISLSQTAEGALSETTHILQRLRELAVQSANDTNNANDRASLQAEVDQLVDEVNRIAGTTNFNGNLLLDGNFLLRDLQVGANMDETLGVSIAGASARQLAAQARYVADTFVSAATLNAANSLTVLSEAGSFVIRDTVAADDQFSTTLRASSAIAKAAAINSSSAQSGVRAIVGPTVLEGSPVDLAGVPQGQIQQFTLNEENFITLNGQKISGFEVQQNDADGALVDALNAVSAKTGVVASVNSFGVLKLVAEDGRNIDLSFSNGGLQADQFGFTANVQSASQSAGLDNFVATGKLTLQSNQNFELSSATPGVIGFAQDGVYGVNADFSVQSLDIGTRDGARVAIDILDLALEDVSAARADLGALQNRLESTISNLTTTSENLSAARSRILDADFAAETATLSRNQIIQQAGVSILAQANQQQQIALSLIQ